MKAGVGAVFTTTPPYVSLRMGSWSLSGTVFPLYPRRPCWTISPGAAGKAIRYTVEAKEAKGEPALNELIFNLCELKNSKMHRILVS